MLKLRIWCGFVALLVCFSGAALAEEEAVQDEAAAVGVCADDACCDNCSQCPLLGFIQPTDTEWSGFISPMTNPVYFEDPRTLSELRLIFVQHKIPSLAGGAIPGSDVQVVAMQVRAALTEELSLIATKDGYIWASPEAPLDDGWADVSLGLKYNLWKDVECQRILSVGAVYEMAVGSTQALQGNGSGQFHLFASYGAEFREVNHFLTSAGFLLPTDTRDENQVFYWSAHVDRQVADTCFYGFLEGNWYHWMSNGSNAALNGIQGGDLFNFGSTGVAGSDIVTAAFGLKWKPTELQEVGVAWEVPVTETRGVLNNRITADYILRY